MPPLTQYYQPQSMYVPPPQVPQQRQSQMPVNSLLEQMLSGGGGYAAAPNMSVGVPESAGMFGNIADMTNIMGQGAETVGNAGSTGASTLGNLGAALPWLGVAGIGAYTGSRAMDAWNKSKNKGAMGGLKQGIKSAGALNFVPVLGQAAWAAGALRGAFGGKKHKDQYARDAMRKDLQGRGFLDDKYNVTLANGQKYDIGRDGSQRLYNTTPQSEGAIGDVQVLAHLLAGKEGKSKDDLTGYLANAAASSGDARMNAREFFRQNGLDHDRAYGMVLQDKGLDPGVRDAFLNGLDQTFGVGAYAGGRTPQAAVPQSPKNQPLMIPRSPAVPSPKNSPLMTGPLAPKPITPLRRP